MGLPKISIVTPSFNQGKFIEQTIQSVLNQNYPNLEYIIIDGGSVDNTVEIIKKYEQHIHYWISEPDNGQTDAVNKGFAKCTGDIFNWLNSDDYYEPGALQTISNLFTSNPAVNIVCGKEWSFVEGSYERRTLNGGSVIKANVFETIRIGIIDQPCTFFRKKSIDSFFPLNIDLHYVMDRLLWWSYLLKNGQDSILQTDKVFTNFRLHPQSKSIGEAALFTTEFDRLKLSLFQQLNAPEILEHQLSKTDSPINIQWEIWIQPQSFILAAFASFFAERKYVNNDLTTSATLMKLVKKWKQNNMNIKEWKLWIVTNLFPSALLTILKKLK